MKVSATMFCLESGGSGWNGDGLGLQVFLETLHPHFAADAALLVAAERQSGAKKLAPLTFSVPLRMRRAMRSARSGSAEHIGPDKPSSESLDRQSTRLNSSH